VAASLQPSVINIVILEDKSKFYYDFLLFFLPLCCSPVAPFTPLFPASGRGQEPMVLAGGGRQGGDGIF
jgi:hypothetical protein